jgi:hypothetical protein
MSKRDTGGERCLGREMPVKKRVASVETCLVREKRRKEDTSEKRRLRREMLRKRDA